MVYRTPVETKIEEAAPVKRELSALVVEDEDEPEWASALEVLWAVEEEALDVKKPNDVEALA